jgi:hypothetical protein
MSSVMEANELSYPQHLCLFNETLRLGTARSKLVDQSGLRGERGHAVAQADVQNYDKVQGSVSSPRCTMTEWPRTIGGGDPPSSDQAWTWRRCARARLVGTVARGPCFLNLRSRRSCFIGKRQAMRVKSNTSQVFGDMHPPLTMQVGWMTNCRWLYHQHANATRRHFIRLDRLSSGLVSELDHKRTVCGLNLAK